MPSKSIRDAIGDLPTSQHDALLRQARDASSLAAQLATDGATARAIADQVVLAKRIADPANTTASLAAQAAVPDVVKRAMVEQRRLRDMASGVDGTARLMKEATGSLGSAAARMLDEQRRVQTIELDRLYKQATGTIGSGVARAIEENQRRFANLVSGGSGLDERYLSPARQALDAIATATPAPAPARGSTTPAPASHPTPAAVAVTSVADIGTRVRAARRAMRMTQQRFADLAGVGRRFVIELEQGKPSLEIGKVLAVCKAAGIALTFAP